MKIDLHTHTFPRSQCSNMTIEELAGEAKRIGLDGFCVTEHQSLWSPQDLEELSQKAGILIFSGNEITTAQGDVLVFGLDMDIQGIITIQQLKKYVDEARGYSILAHPFRGFKLFGIGELQMSVEQACQKKALKYVDAIEIRNAQVRDQENEMAEKVAKILKLPGTSGSDAHNVDDVGKLITIFDQDIKNNEELVDCLREGKFTIGSAR